MAAGKMGTQTAKPRTMDDASNNIPCPLCGQRGSDIIDVLSMSALEKRYRRELGIRFDTQGSRHIALRCCTRCGLKYYAPRLSDDERFYEALQRLPRYYEDDKAEYHIARQYIRPTDDVLEVGAGRGQFAAMIQCKSYTGLEFSPAAIAEAQRAGITLTHESVQDHSQIHPDHYDVVCSFQVLEHVSDPGGFLASAVRCLKPGGRLIVGVPSDDGFVGAAPNVILNMPPHHASRWTDQCLANVADIFDLEVVSLAHEKLADTHLQFYVAAIAQNAIRHTFRMKWHTLDARLYWLPVRILVKALSGTLSMGLSDERMRPNGQTVAAIYAKRSQLV